MTEEKMIQYAIEEGFTDAAVIDTAKIPFEFSFRPFCEENLCGQFGVNYSCPPYCGTPEEMKQRIVSHKKALVLQSVWEISDYTDKAAVKHAKGSHNAAALRLAKRFQEEHCAGFLVGASGCALCTPCAAKNGAPCRFPQLRYSCMSAYCIFVRELTDQCGIVYAPDDGLLPFYGMYIFE